MDFNAISYLEKDSVAFIQLNRPEVLNSFDAGLASELLFALNKAASTPSIRAILLSGAGRAFSAGQDLAEITQPNAPSIDAILSERFNKLVLAIRESRLPVVCAVGGVAAGAGANLALACDIVVASVDASFIQSFIRVGLIPDSGGTYFLPRLIGLSRAAALAMLAEKVSAEDAVRIGMIYRAVPEADLSAEAEKIARVLAGQPTKAITALKRALNESFRNGVHEQLELERTLQVELESTHDYREGVKAFIEKRPPRFSGA